MTVKEILKNTATLVGREDIVSFLAGNQTSDTRTLSSINIMVRLLNLVVNELACSYIPLIQTQECVASDRKIMFSDLQKVPLKILHAYDSFGNDVLKSVTNTFVKVGADKVLLEYSYLPQTFTVEDNVEYQERQVPSRVLAYGLCAEYAISQGCFKDAVSWHNRYADCIAELCAPKNANVKRRDWL